MKLIEMKPLLYKKFAQKLAHLHFEIHKNHVNGVKEQKPYFKDRISWTKDLSDDKKEKLYKLIDSMPDGDCLCHSDFHPDNILCCDNRDCCSFIKKIDKIPFVNDIKPYYTNMKFEKCLIKPQNIFSMQHDIFVIKFDQKCE